MNATPLFSARFHIQTPGKKRRSAGQRLTELEAPSTVLAMAVRLSAESKASRVVLVAGRLESPPHVITVSMVRR